MTEIINKVKMPRYCFSSSPPVERVTTTTHLSQSPSLDVTRIESISMQIRVNSGISVHYVGSAAAWQCLITLLLQEIFYQDQWRTHNFVKGVVIQIVQNLHYR